MHVQRHAGNGVKTGLRVVSHTRAIMEGIASLVAEHAIDGAEIAEIVHGTTVASNALLERKGARTGLIGTQGFRDILEIAYERRYDKYGLHIEKPYTFVPRERVATVSERVTATGQILDPLDFIRLVEPGPRGGGILAAGVARSR